LRLAKAAKLIGQPTPDFVPKRRPPSTPLFALQSALFAHLQKQRADSRRQGAGGQSVRILHKIGTVTDDPAAFFLWLKEQHPAQALVREDIIAVAGVMIGVAKLPFYEPG
jgi:hypothetical protein